MARRVSSSITFTPSVCAFSSLEPASAPATTKSVFLLTEPDTLAPAAMRRSFASSRVSVGKVPVSTKVLPATSEASAAGLGSTTGQTTPEATSASITVRLCGSFRKA